MLKIIILGRPNSGKSTIAYEIERHLRSLGLKGTVNTDPDADYTESWREHQSERLGNMTNQSVTIEVTQAQKMFKVTKAEP